MFYKDVNKTNGNKMQAAKLLTAKRTTLVEKTKCLNIDEGEDDLAEPAGVQPTREL